MINILLSFITISLAEKGHLNYALGGSCSVQQYGTMEHSCETHCFRVNETFEGKKP